MATAISKELLKIVEKIESFAKKEISWREGLYANSKFPFDLWKKMGEEKLLGLSIPEYYGGLGHGFLAMALAGEALVAKGHNMGIALSWFIHLAVAKFFILRLGTKDQKDQFLNKMVKGEITASIAISEPKAGAHPKYLRTQALLQGDQYVLNGEKAYLTNGPIADLFIVIASTGEEGGRKKLTAFLIPRNTPGLTLTEPMDLEFFRPTPHGGIRLSRCKIPSSAILGEKGSAYENIVKPFRELEDAMMMGPTVGGMERQLNLIVDLAKNQKINPEPELLEDLGHFQSLLHCLRIVCYETASMLDSNESHEEYLSLQLAARSISSDAQDLFAGIMAQSGVGADAEMSHLNRDLKAAIGIAKNVARIKKRKIGEKIISRKVRNEKR